MAKKNKGYVGRYETNELEETFNNLTGSKKDKSKGAGKTLPIIAIFACVLIIAIAIYAINTYTVFFNSNGTILDNVKVAGVDVGGMSQEEAISAVQAATDNTYTQTPMVVRIENEQIELPTSYCGTLDVKAAVRDAYRFGRIGTASQREKEQTIAATSGYTVDLTPYLDLNEVAIQDAINQIGKKYSRTPTQSTYTVTGTAPNHKLVINLGVAEYGLNLSELYDSVLEAYSNNVFLYEAQCGLIEPDPIDLAAILEQYYVAPIDATFDKETFDIIEEQEGYGFDIAKAEEIIRETPYGNTVKIPFENLKPEVTAESLSALLFRDTLSSYTTRGGSQYNRNNNLRLACEALNGVVLLPGEVLSYNETLGERTAERGYLPATVYSGGQSVSGLGGGICQVSSTLYYCALLADLEIVDREEHGFTVSYLPLGMDATVSWGTYDFCFKNNMDYPIRIEATASGASTTITLVGTDTRDYYVEMEYEVVGYFGFETVYETMPADNPEGYKDGDVITSPFTGYDVKTYRCKYSKATKELISRDYEDRSVYSSRDKVICKIEGETTPTEPTTPPTIPVVPPTTEPTVPPTTEGTEPPPETTAPTTPGIGNGGVTEEGSPPTE